MLGIGTSILVGGTNKLNDIGKNRVKTKNGKFLSDQIKKQKKNFRILKKTLTKKECGRCGVLKPYSEFYSWKNKNGEINHKNLCKTCEIVKGNIYKSVKKIKCIITSFPKPCSNCEIDDAFIPVFNFHHLNPKLKKEGWAKINGKGIDYILNW